MNPRRHIAPQAFHFFLKVAQLTETVSLTEVSKCQRVKWKTFLPKADSELLTTMIEKFISVSQSYSLVSYVTTERIGLSQRKTSIFCVSIKPTQKNIHPGFFEITSVTTSVSCNLLKGVMWPRCQSSFRVTHKVYLSFSAKDKFSTVHV